MRLLVANRSEIACRIFQACQERGIETVAIVAPGDEQGRHVTYADHVFEVESYLSIASVVDAAKRAKADLIHPGYGFLSERAEFASAVEEAGIRFIGPRPETIELMGGKTAAKELAEKSDVPTLPWARLDDKVSERELKKEAQRIGFPLLLKAAAGGGGKGMRLVSKPDDLFEAAESARAEALSAFGDGTLFLEKFVVRPRHIEVQIFGDGDGEVSHFFERECSLQRRHQKVWEEAPAVRMSEKTRRDLHEAAVRLGKATSYRSAGTVEFLLDHDESFYFLEMNTRLQVEHPVTEWVSGIDLVHAQIDLALGNKKECERILSKTRDATPLGHSIEVRLYAEDPSQSFIPSPGKVSFLKWPTGPGIRVDSGIEVDQEVGTSFDPMLAKLIVWAENRDRAIARMRYALSETVILGVGTNQDFLTSLCDDPAVQRGEVYTHFIERDFLVQYEPELTSDEAEILSSFKPRGTSLSPLGAKENFPSPWRLP